MDKRLKAMGIGLPVVGASLLCWALWPKKSDSTSQALSPKKNDSTSQALPQQATADLIIANISKTVDFAKRISNDIQDIYDQLIATCPQMDNSSDNFVDKIVDLMQRKLKSSYNVDKDYSVEIPGVSDPIKVSTFLSDYIYARLHGKQRGNYDLAVYVMALCLRCESMNSVPTVLNHISDPNGADYNIYKEILDYVSKVLKLEAGNIETLQQVYEQQFDSEERKRDRDSRARLENLKRKDIATIENLKRYSTPGSTVWRKCTDCIAKITSSLQPPYYHQEYPDKEVSELENRMYREFTALEHISNLQDGFSNPKTIFEKYLIKVSNYFKEKLESGATYDSLNESSENDLRNTLKFLAELASSSEHPTNTIAFLNKLKSYLKSLNNLLKVQLDICCNGDTSTLTDLFEKTYAFYNILYNNTMYFNDLANPDYYERLSRDKYASKTNDRELLQVIFNDKRVNKELDRSTERTSLQIRNEQGTKNEQEQLAASYYKGNNYEQIKHFLRLTDKNDISEVSEVIEATPETLNGLRSVIENLKNLIRRTPTEREIKVYRGVTADDPYVRSYLTDMANGAILDKSTRYRANLLFDLKSIETKLEEKEEMIFKEPGFMSTSVSKKVTFDHFTGVGNMKIIQEITVPKGSPCYAYPDTCCRSDEEELLFLPGTKLKLKEIRITGGTPSKDHPGYTHNPKLVVLRFDMISPTDEELAEAAKERDEWWKKRCEKNSPVPTKEERIYYSSEDLKREIIDGMKNYLKRYVTPGSKVWHKCTDFIEEIELGQKPISEMAELKLEMYIEFEVLKYISNLRDGFSNPKTIFEKYLINVSDYFKEKLESGATYDSLNESSENDLRNTLKFLAELAQSSYYAKGRIERKIDFLNDLKSRLDNLIKLLQHQLTICCESDKSKLEDLIKNAYIFYNVLKNITMCFDDHKTSDYYDRLSGDKYASKTTDREILQVIFNDKRVGRELDRSTERSSLQLRNEQGTKNEQEQSAALEYQSDIGVIKDILRLDDKIAYSSTRIDSYCSVITNVTNLIKRTQTQREIKVYRGIHAARSYVRRSLTSMVKDDSILDNGIKYDVNMLFNLNSIQTKLKNGEEMIYKDPGFMSTSVSKRVAFRYFAGPWGGDSMKTVQEITVPPGTPCYAYQDNVNGYSSEKELLFLPGTKLKLKGIKIIGGTPSKDHPGYTHNPKLVVLRFDMISPTDEELAEAAKERDEWWKTHCKEFVQLKKSEKLEESKKSTKPHRRNKCMKIFSAYKILNHMMRF